MDLKPTPERPPEFDPKVERFWDTRDLETELVRVFEICHGCRMCVGYCPSFPFLFTRIDENHELYGKAHSAITLNDSDLREVTDLCFQCKLCYVKCPYTDDDHHPWRVDVPRLLWREKVLRTAREGSTLQEKLLGEPGLLGRINSGPMAPLANFISAQSLVRKTIDKLAGIAPEFALPTYAREPFSRWLKKRKRVEPTPGQRAVAIFSTCLVEYNRPSTGRAMVAVLEHSGFAVSLPEQVCCGMPNMDTGDLDAVREKARYNLASLVKEVRAGRDIVCPGPSCSMTLRREYPELAGSEEARLVAAHTYDLMEYLWKLYREGALPKTFSASLGSVAYHAPCHLRALKISLPARMLMEKVPDTEVTVIEQCSAVDGTWGMMSQHYAQGVKYSRKLVRGVRDAEAAYVASDCPLASQRIVKENKVAVWHPVELIARAYGLPTE